MDDLTGQQIKGYELRDRLGAGGFGAVYKAYQPQVGREVAIKIILPLYANHPDFIRRFEVEARVIARLEHPHIIPMYDYWRDSSGAYLVMRYLRGGSLRSMIKDRPLSLEAASRLLDQMAGALAIAHRHGVIHRDIKPDNILLDDENNPYLTDFGIAKDLENDSGVTQADTVIGSPAYLSPEQVKGEDVIPQSDIYSLGIVLFEILTGEHPFSNEKVTTLLLKHLNEPLPSISAHREDIPDSVEAVIHKATAKNPDERYADAPTLAAAFRSAIQSDQGGSSQFSFSSTGLIDRTLLLEEIDLDNPYKGLEAFEEVDSANFFGREKLIEHLLSVLRKKKSGEHFMAIIGPSGSGKSSVVQAGLIPRMRTDTLPGSSRWFIVEMLPGSRPLEELEAALLRIAVNPPPSLLAQLKEDERGLVRATKRILSDDKSELFLFIDQFEEVFSRATDKAEVAHFLNSLVTAATDPECRLRVVITLRADFYDQPLLYPAFGDLVRQYTEVVLPMTPEELQRAIAGPAERVGVLLEPGLVQEIIADVEEEPGALPLLQYALTELFERRAGRVLTIEAYHSIGRALGALARQAEEQYAQLDKKGQELARLLFLRLVSLGEGGTEDKRRRVLHTEIASLDAGMEAIINAFDQTRLLSFNHDPITREPVIEVAHEALIRQWQRLRDWLEESREDLIMQRKLSTAAQEWLNAGKDASYLASGTRLEQFETWQQETRLGMSHEENDYLQQSIAEREARKAREAERQAREDALEERSRSRLRMLVMVMALATVVAIVLASYAVTANQAAQEARVEAEANADRASMSAAEARSLALDANARNLLNENQPALALALAIEAYNAYQPPAAEVQQTLARAAYGPNSRYRWQAHTGSVLDVATNGELALTVGADGELLLWEIATGEQSTTTFDLGDEVAHTVDISADGERAVSGMFSGAIILWDVTSGDVLQRLEGHSDIVTDIAFSPDESQILSGSMDRTIQLWDVDSGDNLLVIESPGAILRVVFSPDGSNAASSSADRTAGANHPPEERDRMIRVWDLETGEEIQSFAPNSGFVRAIDYSPDGQFILSGTWNSAEDGTLQLWNIGSGQLERRFYGVHTDIITDVQFSQDGQRILTASWDRSIRLWDVATGIELEHLEGHQDRALTVAFTPNEDYVLVGTGNIGNNIPDYENDLASDTSVWVWDLRGRAEVLRVTGHTDWVWAVDVSPDGRYGATGSGPISLPADGSSDVSVRLWDLQTGEEVQRFEGHTHTINWLDFSPDGEHILSASWDGTVREWPVAGGDGRVAFEGHTDRVLSVAYSPDGSQALSTSRDQTVRLWDIATGEEIQHFEGHTADVTSAAFSPDGTLIASTSNDETVRLWDVSTGEEVRQFTGHAGTVNTVIFSPDGQYILSTGWDTTARLWDVATGEEVRQFIGHSRAVFGAAFNSDGTMLTTTSSDFSVRLWELATGDEIRRFDGHTNWVLSVAYAPDDSFIFTGAEDNTGRVWQMARDMPELIDWATENRYIAELTCPEREQYRVEPLCGSETATEEPQPAG